MAARFESGITELIQNNEDIKDILQSLSTFFKVDISPYFCASLFQPLIEHTIHNDQLTQQSTSYVLVLIELYKYILSKEFIAANDFVNDIVSLIQAILLEFREESVESSRYTFNLDALADDTLLDIMAILIKSCDMIMVINIQEMNTNANLNIMWNSLSGILDCGTMESSDIIYSIIMATTNIIQSFLHTKFNVTYNTNIESILESLVLLTNENSLPTPILIDVAGSISSIIQNFPNTKLIDPYRLAALTDASATLSRQKEPNTIILRAILNLSCLILKNYTKAPWLEDILSMSDTEELEILKEKTILLMQATSNVSFTHYQEEDMEIDQNSLQRNSNPNSLLNCSTVHKMLLVKVSPIISQLTTLEGTNTEKKSAITKLKEIAIFTDNTDISIICQSHMKTITECVARALISDPYIAESVTSMFGFTQYQFISKHLQYALPYSIFQVEGGKLLKVIAKTLEISPTILTNDYGYHIVLALLLETNKQVKAANLAKVQLVKSDGVKVWAASKSTKITTILAMNLGKEELKEQSLKALNEMKGLIFNSPTSTPVSLSHYLAQYFVAISTKISRFITEKRSKNLVTYEPHALNALKEIMVLLDSKINLHATLLMKLFQTVNELDNMQLEALSLWKIFIATIDNSALVSIFNRIVYGLLKIMTVSTHSIRVLVAQVLQEVFDREIETIAPDISELPVLPEFEELRTLKSSLEVRLLKKKQSGQKMLAEILNRLDVSDDVQVLFELQKLNILLSDILQEFPIDVGELFSQLLFLMKKYASNKDISYLIALCFGKVGAIDPSLINVRTEDNNIFVLNSFQSEKENRVFICQLLSNHVFNAYNAVKNEYILQFLQMAIQSLLKCAGFTEQSDLRSEALLPKPVQEFLAPYLNSSFQFSFKETDTQYPIFTQTGSFSDWVKQWYTHMIAETRGTARTMFDACLPIVVSDVVDITVHLIPYVVLHSILSGSSNGNNGILREMLTILDINAEPESDLDRRSLNRQYLQVVVSITEYCRKWLNKISHRELSRLSEINRVRSFLGQIPDKTMAIAAYHSKAYPQALMHFETHLKSEQSESIEPEILGYLRKVYTQMENLVDLSALLKVKSNVLTHDEEMIRFEIEGKWEEAEILHKNKISANPHDLSLYMGYNDCLKKWGKYETILYSSDKVIADLPNYVSHLNSLKIDSAWRVSDWRILDKAIALPMQKTPEAMVGCIISKMRKNQNLETASCLVKARELLVDQLSSDFTKSYRKSYSTIYNLQILQELETSQSVWESENPVEIIRKLGRNWDYNHQNIVSNYQYRHNLLELRKAAFFDIRQNPEKKIEASQAWLKIAKSYRKAGNLLTAYDAIIKAEQSSGVYYYNEKAKWYWAAGLKKKACDLLVSMSSMEMMRHEDAILIAKFYDRGNSLIDKSKIRMYFAAALKNGEASEKLIHSCTMYYSKIQIDHDDIPTKMKVLAYIAKSSAKTLQHGSKYYYSSMSMLLNSWFELAKSQINPPVFSNKANSKFNREVWEKHVNEQLKLTNLLMQTITNQVPIIQFSLFLTRLISYLTFDNTEIAECLMKIIGDVFVEFPKSSIWLLLAVENSLEQNVAQRVKKILNRAQNVHGDSMIPAIINQARTLVAELQNLSDTPFQKQIRGNVELSNQSRFKNLFQQRNLDIYIPTEASLYPTLPQLMDRGSITSRMFPTDLPYINSIDSNIFVMNSLQKPKRITIQGSDGKEYRFLVKSNDDLRKDARTMEFNYAINSFLKKNPESRDNELYIRTYAVIPLGDKWGLIQWIDNISPLKAIVNQQWEQDGCKSIQDMSILLNKYTLTLPRELHKIFTQTILPKCPPVFYKWFLQCFPEPNQWLASRTRYTKTLAVMSIVGYMIGLGDRHAENILFDETNGDCVHVDLNMLFDMGSGLSVPEVVPFRLTHNLVDAMGILGYTGTFTVTCEITMNVLLQNKDALTSVFQTLGNTWIFAKDALELDLEKNIVSRNEVKFREQMELKFKVKPGTHAKVKVEQLIADASDPNNLCKMFAGWAPFV